MGDDAGWELGVPRGRSFAEICLAGGMGRLYSGSLEGTPMKSLKIWTKPTIDVTSIKLAEYYNNNRSDAAGALHQS